MNVLEKLYRDRGFKTEIILLQGKTELNKIFNALNLADWTAYYSAKMYVVEPEQVPMVEEFKSSSRGTADKVRRCQASNAIHKLRFSEKQI